MKTNQKTKKTIRTIFAISGLMSLGFLTQLNTFSASAADDPEEPTITINTVSDTASLNITPTDTDGTFATSANSDIVFNVSTNNFSGYSLSVTTSNNSPSLVNGETTINTINSALTATEFDSDVNNNKWGFKPNKFYDATMRATIDNSGEEGVFLPAPTSATQLDKTAAANTISNDYSITVGLRVNLNTNAGEYNGVLNIVSVANPVAYIIDFDGNASAGETVTDFPEGVDNTTFGSSVTLPSNIPAREHYTFIGWCSVAPANDNGTDTCTGENATTYQPGGAYTISHLAANNATLYAMWQIDSFVQSVRYRYENADGSFTGWTDAEDETINYGETFDWIPAEKIKNFNDDPYVVNTLSYMVTEDKSSDVTFMRKWYTCRKVFRLENADNTYPEEFTFDEDEYIRYGLRCEYGKFDIAGYRSKYQILFPTETYQALVIHDMSLERMAFTLTINRGGDVANVVGSGEYKWGTEITLTATTPESSHCRTYNAPAWTNNTSNGSFADGNTGNTVQFVMGMGNTTISVNSDHTDILQTITFSTQNGDTITFNNTEYNDGDSTQVYCGNYNIAGTLKEQEPEERIYIQDITPATCPTVKTKVYDRRDEEPYYIQKLADGNCWLLDNLRLDPTNTVTLTTANTNMSPEVDFVLPNSQSGGGYSFDSLEDPKLNSDSKNTGLTAWWSAEEGEFRNVYMMDTTYTVSDSTTLAFTEASRVGIYYNFCAATAGSFCEESKTSDGEIKDICPANWHMPSGATHGEYAHLRWAYDTNDDFISASNTIPAGAYIHGSTWHQRNIGYYWAATTYTNGNAYVLQTSGNGGVGAENFNERVDGFSVRCTMNIPTEP